MSVLTRQHDRDDPLSKGRIGRVRGVARQRPIKVVDLEEDSCAIAGELTKVVFLMWIVGLVTFVIGGTSR